MSKTKTKKNVTPATPTDPNEKFEVCQRTVDEYRRGHRETHIRKASLRTYKLTLSLAERNLLWDLLQDYADSPFSCGEGRAMALYAIKAIKGHPFTKNGAYKVGENY